MSICTVQTPILVSYHEKNVDIIIGADIDHNDVRLYKQYSARECYYAKDYCTKPKL